LCYSELHKAEEMATCKLNVAQSDGSTQTDKIKASVDVKIKQTEIVKEAVE
jgi:hypothetical protein